MNGFGFATVACLIPCSQLDMSSLSQGKCIQTLAVGRVVTALAGCVLTGAWGGLKLPCCALSMASALANGLVCDCWRIAESPAVGTGLVRDGAAGFAGAVEKRSENFSYGEVVGGLAIAVGGVAFIFATGAIGAEGATGATGATGALCTGAGGATFGFGALYTKLPERLA